MDALKLAPAGGFSSVAAPLAMGAGTVLSTKGQLDQARAAKTIAARQHAGADFEAAQLDVNAGQAIAAAQREAMEQERQARVYASRALAVGAATGSATDPTVMNVIADIEGVGALRKATALYQGEEKARQLRMGADVRRLEGDIALEGGELTSRAYKTAAFGTAIGGGGSLFAKYGIGGPNKKPLDTSGALDRYDLGNVADPRYG